MPADLDINQETGEAAMISRRLTPWHRAGIVFEEDLDLDEALRLAGLDFRVRKVPHYIAVPQRVFTFPIMVTEEDARERLRIRGVSLEGLQFTRDAIGLQVDRVDHKQSGDSFSIIREDRMEAIGTVGSTYEPLQNEDGFGVVRPLVEEGTAVIETAGSLRGGKQVWLLVRFDVETIVEKAIEAGADPKLLEALVDESLPYGLFTGDHSGGAKARIKETGIRVVCANTFDASMGSKEDGTSVEVTHGKNVVEAYAAAAKIMLAGVGSRFAKLAEARETMEATPLRDYGGWGERPYQRLVLDRIVPIAHLEEKIRRRDDNPHTRAALERASEKRMEIRTLWDDGAGHAGSGSAWEAFQGAVEWIDHAGSALVGSSDRDVRRVTSLHDGGLGRTKNRIARGLFAYAASDDDGKERMVFGS